MCVLKCFCSLEACLNIENFVSCKTKSFEKFGLWENGVLIKFSMEFDCDMDLVGKINKIDDFLIA